MYTLVSSFFFFLSWTVVLYRANLLVFTVSYGLLQLVTIPRGTTYSAHVVARAHTHTLTCTHINSEWSFHSCPRTGSLELWHIHRWVLLAVKRITKWTCQMGPLESRFKIQVLKILLQQLTTTEHFCSANSAHIVSLVAPDFVLQAWNKHWLFQNYTSQRLEVVIFSRHLHPFNNKQVTVSLLCSPHLC